MAKTYTEEQLNTFDKATLIQLLLMQQSQLQEIDKKLQLLLEQAAVLKNNRFGKKSEKLGIENQVCFMEVDGDIVFFNEAEAVNALVPEDEEKSTKPKNAKTKGKRTADIKDLPVIHVDHKMTESELITEFGEDGWYQLEDEIYRRYRFTPMKIEIEEHHVGVYKSKKDNHFKKAEHPAYLLRNSLVSPTLLSGIWNAKYVNAVPLYRQEQEWKNKGLLLSRQTMSNWLLRCSADWLEPVYKVLHQQLVKHDIIHADETELQVLREPGKAAKSQSYMWLYRTGCDAKHPIVLYEYQANRSGEHPKAFLEDFHGFLQTDGYSGYHAVENVTHIGCFSHARRKFEDAIKAQPKGKRSPTAEQGVAYCSKLFQLEDVYEGLQLTFEERKKQRLERSKPVLDAMLAWANTRNAAPKSKLGIASAGRTHRAEQ